MNNEEKILQLILAIKKEMNERFDAIDERFEAVDGRFDTMDKRFEAVNERFDAVEVQVKENTDIIKALFRNQEITNVKLESLKLTIAKTEGLQMVSQDIVRLENKIDVLAKRLFEQEAEIQGLKRVK